MNFMDLKYQQGRIRERIEENIGRVLNHGQYIMGPEVKILEDKLAAYVGSRHAIACSSGTDALLMALMACKVGPGDAIFTTPFTFIATAEVIALLGATPVFVDIDPRTYNLDSLQLEKAISAIISNDPSIYPLPNHGLRPLTPKGVIAVDLFGLPADCDAIGTIAHQNNLFLIEDAAQSFGAEYKGKKACGLGDIGCTSFFPAKPLGCYGDGGMCFADDDELADSMRSIRVHGKGAHKYDNIRIGINGRLDTLQAAILLSKFEIFPEEVELRQQVAGNYRAGLADNKSITLPYVPVNSKSVWAQYSILAQSEGHRSTLENTLNKAGIPTAIYYPKPLHLQSAFSYLGYEKGTFPVSEVSAARIFSLPMHPYMNIEDQQMIANLLAS